MKELKRSNQLVLKTSIIEMHRLEVLQTSVHASLRGTIVFNILKHQNAEVEFLKKCNFTNKKKQTISELLVKNC